MRLRIEYTKLGRIRFVGHRDLARIWERAARRAEVPLEYSEGFTPHPRISFGNALPVGWESTAEYLDMVVAEGTDCSKAIEAVDAALPTGMEITGSSPVDVRAESLSSFLSEATYLVALRDPSGVDGAAFAGKVERCASQLMALDAVLVSRKKKGEVVVGDIRPLVVDIAMSDASLPAPVGDGELVVAKMILATKPRVLRPEEVAAALSDAGCPAEAVLVRKIAQHGYVDGVRMTPFDASGADRTNESEGRRLDETLQEKEKRTRTEIGIRRTGTG